ncbi:unnamed protein product [Phytomonas sp. EM1]|nr:unnamed protein product [Phytomonas sp. EM1]|eukprot:CCW62258.1 unnamed protein product [Phytomonas sp. isolate EM1]
METRKERDLYIPKNGETFFAKDGTESQVLSDVIDENYNPTEEEVEQYALSLGMKLPEDKMFLPIARAGLKELLPQEWRPCRNSKNDLYYFNFKTGETSSKHPVDCIYEKRYQEAKRRQLAEQKKNSVGSASPMSTGIPSQGNGTPKSQLQRELPAWGQGVVKKAGDDASFSYSTANNSTKLAGEASMARQAPAPTSSDKSLFDRSMALFSADLLAPALSVSFNANESSSPLLAASQQRIVSESEYALEESIRAELKESFEAEKLKAESLQKSTLEAMRKQHEEELREIQIEEAKRYGDDDYADAEIALGESFRGLSIEEIDAHIEKKYSTLLADLEKEAKSLEAQLKESRMEKTRKEDLIRRNQLAVEREAAAEKENMVREMELEMEKYLEDKKKELDTLFQTKSDAIKKSSKASLERAQQMMSRSFKQKEAHVLSSTELSRKRLEIEKKKIEMSIRNMTNALSSLGIASAPGSAADSSQENSAVLTAIINKRDTACAELRTKILQEQEALREEEAFFPRLQSQLADKNVALPLAILVDSTKNIENPSTDAFTPISDSPVECVEDSSEYNAILESLRAAYANEKERSLANLAKEREVKLRALSAENAKSAQLPASWVTPLSSTGRSLRFMDEGTHPIMIEGTSNAPLNQARYESTEEDLAKRLAQNFERARTDGAQWLSKAGGHEALDTDVGSYVKQGSTPHGQLAQTKPHQEEMSGDLGKPITISTDAAESEKNKGLALADNEKQTLERCTEYLQEEKLLRKKIDEEMEVYFASEREKLHQKATSTPAGAGNFSSAAPRLDKSHSKRRDSDLPQQAELAEMRAIIEVKRRKAQELNEQLSREARSESPNTYPEFTTVPPRCISRDAYEARMAALEESYREQEETLRMELAEWSRRRAAATRESPSPGITKTLRGIQGGRGEYHVRAHSQSTEPAAADGLAAWSQPMTTAGDFQTSDALRYWKRQREYVTELHHDLDSLRQGNVSTEACGAQKEPLGLFSVPQSGSVAPPPPFSFHEPSHLHRTQSSGMLDSHPLKTPRSAEFLTVSVDGLNSRLSKLVSTMTGQRHQSTRREGRSQLTPSHQDSLRKKWDHALQEYFFSITEGPYENF